jgi:regulator of protease activity HflC (stomatin/prohibitin superfamily)
MASTTNDTTLQKFGLDNWGIPESVKRHTYFVELNKRSMVEAFYEIDKRMKNAGDYHLITNKKTRGFFGREIQAGQVGLYAYKGRPVMAIIPGFYWNFSLTHRFLRTFDITDQIHEYGFTSAQVGQSGALVVEDPENRIFVIRNGGFVAFGAHGRFRVLASVDLLNLGDDSAVYEAITLHQRRILGHRKEIKVEGIIIATFLNVPANNVAIVQQGNELLLLDAGQHVINDPKTTFRRFYSLGERQVQIKTQPAYTVEGVPVVLNVNLRYRVLDAITLSKNYDDPFQALANPAQTAVNSVVSRLSYQQFMRAKKVGGDIPDIDVVPWIESFKTECLSELREQAETYGIVVESFDVLDRELEGALGKDLEKQAEQVLQNQMRATQVELQNRIATETQRGLLEISRVKAEQTKTDADASFYGATKKTDAAFYTDMKNAEAKAKASELEACQNAKNIVLIAEAKKHEVDLLSDAYASVTSEHAKRLQLEEIEVLKRKALPSQTIYFANEANKLCSDVAEGYSFSVGKSLASKDRT